MFLLAKKTQKLQNAQKMAGNIQTKSLGKSERKRERKHFS